MAHFSKEELQEISNYLIKQGIKDSEFQITQDVSGEVFVAIVKGGKNRRISIGNFADGVLSLTMDEILIRVDALIQASEDKLTTIFEGEIEFTAQHLQTKFSEQIVDATGVLEHEFNTKIEQTAREISMQAEENLRNTAEGLEEDYNSKLSITARQIRSDVDAEIRHTEQQITESYHSEISQTAQQIRTEVDKEIIDTAEGLDAKFQSSITQTAEEIRTDVSKQITDASDTVLQESKSYTLQTADRIEQGVEAQIQDSEQNTKETLRSEIAQTAAEIRTDVDREITDTANELNSEFHSEISQTAEEIRTEVTREITDSTGATLDAARSYTEQTADRITQGVEQAIADSENQTKSELRSELNQTASEITATVEANKEEADGSIQELQGQLTIQAGLISAKVSQTDYDADKTLTEERFSEIEQTAEQIQSTVAVNKAEADGQFIEQQSQITQQAGLISQKVEQTEYDANKTEVDSRFSLVEQTAEQIQLQVTENRQIEDGRYQSTQSQITEQAGQIASKVSQDEFDAYEGQVSNKFSQIEQTEAGITATVEQHTSQLSSQAGLLTEYYNWLSSLQTQVDKEIDTWFENYPPVTVDSHGVPTSTTPLMVYPYSDWYNAETPDDPEAVRERHVEDVFYDNSTGYGFRFSATGNKGSRVYEWALITDSAVIAALAAAAAAQAAADGKIRAFLTTPTAPYSYGDLWIKDVKLYPGTASEVTLKQTFTCSRAEGRAEGTVITPEMLAADWEPVEDYAIEVAKANLQILANATINYATQFTYNADGTISDTTSGAITTAAGQIRLQVANGAIDTAVGPNGKITTPLLGTGIDIVNGEITLIANKISLKNQNDVTGLALTTIGTSPNQKVVIDVSSLNVAGIFTTSNWTTIATNIDNAAQGYAGTAESNAESYADTAAGNALSSAQTYADNAVDYFNQHVFTPLASTVGDMGTDLTVLNGYRTAMLDNMTLITGGLVLSTLIELGSGTPGQSGWEVHAGISGIYDNTAGHGGGIAAWYGGPRVDHEVSPGTTPYAKSLFRMDGSGYLAGGEISWGSSGSVVIHGATLYDGQDTISIAQLIELYSWFEKVSFTDSQGNTRYALKLVTGTDTNLAGFCTDGFITAGGVGTGGGGGGGDLDVNTMYINLANGQGADPLYFTREINVSHLHEFWKSLQNNDNVNTYDNYKIAIAHLPTPGAGLSITQSGSGSSIATSIGIDSNYKLPTTTEWSNKADASALAGYLPLSGGTLSKSYAVILSLNNSAPYASEVFLFANLNGTTKAAFGYNTSYAFISNETTTARIGVNDAGTPIYMASNSSQSNTLYHSGNCNSSSVPWEGSAIKSYTNFEVANTTSNSDLNAFDAIASNMTGYLTVRFGYGTGMNERAQLVFKKGTTNNKLYIGFQDNFEHLVLSSDTTVGVGGSSGGYKFGVNGTLNATTIYENGTALSSKYLALSGGTINSASGYPLTLNTTTSDLNILRFSINGTQYGSLEVYGPNYTYGTAIFYGNDYVNLSSDGTFKLNNSQTFLHTGNYSNYALPLTGGTLTSSSYNVLVLKSTNTTLSALNFYSNLTKVGGIECYSADAPYGTLIYNYNGNYINLAKDNQLKLNNSSVFYHSGNSNLTTVPWSASTLTLNGAISGATNIDSLLYFDTTNSRVGIGTASPSYELDVAGAARVWSLYMAAGGIVDLANINSLVYFDRTNSRVGIGTPSPAYKLDVSGNICSRSTLCVDNTASGAVVNVLNMTAGNMGSGDLMTLLFGKSLSTNNQAQLIYYHTGDGSSANKLYFGFRDNWSLAYLDASGHFYVNGGISSDGYVTAGAAASSSDRAMKDNILRVTPGKAKSIIMSLYPSEWIWNDKNEYLCGKRGAGLISQEVEQILDYAVLKEGKYQSLNYNVLHAFEIALAQDHESRIEKLEKENKMLKEEIKKLNPSFVMS